MKNLLILFLLLNASCKCSKTNNIKDVSSTTAIEKTPTDSVPICIRNLIKKLEAEPVTSPPSKVYQYTFEGKTVFYLPPVCCDNFSELYNDSCKIIAYPDGGFTGKGDRRLPNFHDDKKEEKLIWEDKRKQ